MRISKSSTARRAIAAVSPSFPSVVLIAISAREIALSSRMFSGFCNAEATRLLRRSGVSTAKIRTAVSSRIRTSIPPRKQGFDLFVRHRLPPILVEHPNFTSQGAQRSLFASRLLGAHNVHDRHTPAADGHGLALLSRLDQLRQLVFCVGYTELHNRMIAI